MREIGILLGDNYGSPSPKAKRNWASISAKDHAVVTDEDFEAAAEERKHDVMGHVHPFGLAHPPLLASFT